MQENLEEQRSLQDASCSGTNWKRSEYGKKRQDILTRSCHFNWEDSLRSLLLKDLKDWVVCSATGSLVYYRQTVVASLVWLIVLQLAAGMAHYHPVPLEVYVYCLLFKILKIGWSSVLLVALCIIDCDRLLSYVWLVLYCTQLQECRTITQFHFTSWPDFGVPQSPLGMMKFVKRVKASNPDRAGPIIVHCRYIVSQCCIVVCYLVGIGDMLYTQIFMNPFTLRKTIRIKHLSE